MAPPAGPATHEAEGGSSNQALAADAALPDYLTYAALHNPGLKEAFHQWKAALERIPQVQSLPDPTFTYGYFIREVETRVGPQEHRIGLRQKVPWFGTLRLRGDAASEAAEAAFQRYQGQKLRLFFEVKQAYYEYYYLHRALSITEDNIQLLQHFETVARARHRAGASQSAVIKAQVEVGKLNDRLRSLRALRGPLAARLNAALNRPSDAFVSWPREAPLEEIELNQAEASRCLSADHPELTALEHRIAQQENALALAGKAFSPDVMIGMDYLMTGEALASGTPDSGKDPVVAVVGLDIPLWRGTYRAAEREARRRLHAAQHARAERENRLQADLAMAIYRFRDAERKTELYGDTLIPQARQALKIAEEGYRAGAEDFLSLVDAERLLLEFQLARERALVDRAIAAAEVESLIGVPLQTLDRHPGYPSHEDQR